MGDSPMFLLKTTGGSPVPHGDTLAKIAITFGLLLVVLGIVGFVATGSTHKTALIPAYFGAPIVLCGILALKPSLRMHAMHGAAAVGSLAFLGSLVMVAMTLVRLAGGAELARPVAFVMQVLMLVLSGLFLFLCVRSFVAARRNRVGDGV